LQRWLGSIACGAVLAALATGVAASPEATPCGDVLRTTLYPRDEGGPSDLAARDFLWSHWSTNRCADLWLAAISREGVRTDSHYAIIPSPSGRPILRVTLVRSDAPTKPDEYTATLIERVVPDVPYDLAKARTIPDSSKVAASAYRLRFRDASGAIVTDF
jgi:hypothetical protein